MEHFVNPFSYFIRYELYLIPQFQDKSLSENKFDLEMVLA